MRSNPNIIKNPAAWESYKVASCRFSCFQYVFYEASQAIKFSKKCLSLKLKPGLRSFGMHKSTPNYRKPATGNLTSPRNRELGTGNQPQVPKTFNHRQEFLHFMKRNHIGSVA